MTLLPYLEWHSYPILSYLLLPSHSSTVPRLPCPFRLLQTKRCLALPVRWLPIYLHTCPFYPLYLPSRNAPQRIPTHNPLPKKNLRIHPLVSPLASCRVLSLLFVFVFLCVLSVRLPSPVKPPPLRSFRRFLSYRVLSCLVSVCLCFPFFFFIPRMRVTIARWSRIGGWGRRGGVGYEG